MNPEVSLDAIEDPIELKALAYDQIALGEMLDAQRAQVNANLQAINARLQVVLQAAPLEVISEPPVHEGRVTHPPAKPAKAAAARKRPAGKR